MPIESHNLLTSGRDVQIPSIVPIARYGMFGIAVAR